MAEAPRFHALWTSIHGRSVLVMPRSDWDAASVRFGSPVSLDVAQTPLAAVARQAVVLAAVAQQVSETMAEVAIFREDPKDPLPINQDKYSVWLDIPSHPNFAQMVTRASTEDNANLRQYLSENVFLVKQDHRGDHWLSTLPATVAATFKST